MQFVIIADDLTGADDSASQFASLGLSAHVSLRAQDIVSFQDTDVFILDTESRDLNEDEARSKIKEACNYLLSLHPLPVVFKKVDSTLRGGVGAELEELIEALKPSLTLFAPAYPDNGRTTAEGRQYLHGVPLEKTQMAQVPKSPVTTSYIKEILGKGTGLQPELINLSAVHKGPEAVASAVNRALAEGCTLFIGDAAEPGDLSNLVKACDRPGVLYGGCAGLAKAVSEHYQALHGSRSPVARDDLKPLCENQGILYLSGSISPQSRAQCRHLMEHTDCVKVMPDLKLLLTDHYKAAGKAAAQIKALPRGASVLVTTALNDEDVKLIKQTSEELSLSCFEAGERCAQTLALVMQKCAQNFEAFVMTGGDTAVHACLAVGAVSFKVTGELETGIAKGVIASGLLTGRPLITKAGAFGAEPAFTRIYAALKGCSCPNLIESGHFEIKKMKKPVLGITMGDPAGVGAEIIVKSLSNPSLYKTCSPVVFGDAGQIERAACLLGLKDKVQVHSIEHPQEAKPSAANIEVVDLHNVPYDIPYGKVNAVCGKAACEYIAKAVECTKGFSIHAIVTAPLNKEALHLGGCPYPGHTEILAALTQTKDYSMMLSSPKLKVIHVSTHISLRKACDAATKERVLTVIKLACEALKLMGYSNPRIAVAGLNPHSGEGGLFGNEEIKEIIPAIREAQTLGLNVTGPVPPDTVFHRAANKGEFDIVVVMYHDQGHIPLKVLGFDTGVNVTVGLPCIRASVDHGTAFDIAGKGIAGCESMDAALSLAAAMASARFADKLQD